MLLAAELTLLATELDARGYIAGHVFCLLVDPGGVFAQIARWCP
jgi:hypothetical protein